MALLALLDPLVLLAPQEMLVPLVPLVLIQLFPGQLALLDHKGISVLLDLLALLELIL